MAKNYQAPSSGAVAGPDNVFSVGQVAMGIVKSLRPRQWTKNILVFAGLLFSGKMLVSELWLPAAGAFLAFCLLASAIYLCNDVIDRAQDRLHPKKRFRPIAAGIVSPRLALGVGLGLGVVGVGIAVGLGIQVGSLALAYLALNLAYIVKLKAVPILDIFTVALGFVIRAVVGVVAIGAEVSPWFLLCTVLLSLLLVLGKRRHELLLLAGEAAQHRRVLQSYSQKFLDQMISVITTATLVSYFLYTFFSPTAGQKHGLMWTIPPVLYGLFRYVYLVYEEDQGGQPEEILLQDKGILASVLVWGISLVVVLYVVG